VIAVDTSSLIAYLSGNRAADTEALELALAERQVCLPPVVLTELLSDPTLSAELAEIFKVLPMLAVGEGFWERAGPLRAKVIARRRKAPLADTLIAQSCMDYDVPLITRDPHFKAFAAAGGLRLFG
jgi:predicted nucleic acid-binding protein